MLRTNLTRFWSRLREATESWERRFPTGVLGWVLIVGSFAVAASFIRFVIYELVAPHRNWLLLSMAWVGAVVFESVVITGLRTRLWRRKGTGLR